LVIVGCMVLGQSMLLCVRVYQTIDLDEHITLLEGLLPTTTMPKEQQDGYTKFQNMIVLLLHDGFAQFHHLILCNKSIKSFGGTLTICHIDQALIDAIYEAVLWPILFF